MIPQWHNARGRAQLPSAALGTNIARALPRDHWVWGGGGGISRIIFPTIVWKNENFFIFEMQKNQSNTAFLQLKTYFNGVFTPFKGISGHFHPRLYHFCTIFGAKLSNMPILYQYTEHLIPSTCTQYMLCNPKVPQKYWKMLRNAAKCSYEASNLVQLPKKL